MPSPDFKIFTSLLSSQSFLGKCLVVQEVLQITSVSPCLFLSPAFLPDPADIALPHLSGRCKAYPCPYQGQRSHPRRCEWHQEGTQIPATGCQNNRNTAFFPYQSRHKRLDSNNNGVSLYTRAQEPREEALVLEMELEYKPDLPL